MQYSPNNLVLIYGVLIYSSESMFNFSYSKLLLRNLPIWSKIHNNNKSFQWSVLILLAVFHCDISSVSQQCLCVDIVKVESNLTVGKQSSVAPHPTFEPHKIAHSSLLLCAALLKGWACSFLLLLIISGVDSSWQLKEQRGFTLQTEGFPENFFQLEDGKITWLCNTPTLCKNYIFWHYDTTSMMQ